MGDLLPGHGQDREDVPGGGLMGERMNDKSCYDCTHRKVDHENYPYCGRTGYWLGVHDKAYCCVHYEDVDEE